MRQKVNVVNEGTDKNCERRIGILNPVTNMVKTSDGREKSLSHYEKIDPNGVGYFETRNAGEIVQKSGKIIH